MKQRLQNLASPSPLFSSIRSSPTRSLAIRARLRVFLHLRRLFCPLLYLLIRVSFSFLVSSSLFIMFFFQFRIHSLPSSLLSFFPFLNYFFFFLWFWVLVCWWWCVHVCMCVYVRVCVRESERESLHVHLIIFIPLFAFAFNAFFSCCLSHFNRFGLLGSIASYFSFSSFNF